MNDKQEQLKQLKKGEKILIEAEFWGIHADGDIQFGFPCKSLEGYRQMTSEYVIPEHVSLMPKKPKYDPCRRFKKGDKVKLREEVQGRHTSLFVTGLSLGKIYTVEHDEYNHTVAIIGDKGLCRYSFVHLELVAPVEELQPYSVGESTDYFSVDKDDEELCLYWKDKHPHAKKAAENERDRLNAEHRKGEA